MKQLKKVLLVDDDELFNYIHREILKNSNTAEIIDVTLNGKEALKYLDENNYPDLILLDIDMPVMNGFEFLAEFKLLQNTGKNTKIIMLTSSLNQIDIDKAKEFNVDGYINKPLSVEKLQEMLVQ